MELVSQLLGGLGVLGILGAVLLGGTVLVVLPWWALVDCVRSERESGYKAFLVVALVVTWGLGAIVYGIFGATSRGLRIFTIVGLFVPLLILVPSAISLVTGAGMSHRLIAAKERAEMERIVAAFQPSVLPDDALGSFVALRFDQGRVAPRATTLARFTLRGPDPDTARDVDKAVRHVAYDDATGRHFALTRHEFGTITPTSGRFTRVEVDPSLGQFSWPKGIAFDTSEQAVFIMTSHVYTRFYRFDPQTSDWARLPAETRDLSLVALAYSAEEDCLYALEHQYREPSLHTIHRFNDRGANLGTVRLNPQIPISRDQMEFFQLHYSGGRLVLVLPGLEATGGVSGQAPAQPDGDRLFVIDPSDGQVFAPAGSVSTPR